MRALLAALLLASSQALLLPRVPQATAVRVRSPAMLFDGLFGKKDAAPSRSSTNLNEILRKPGPGIGPVDFDTSKLIL